MLYAGNTFLSSVVSHMLYAGNTFLSSVVSHKYQVEIDYALSQEVLLLICSYNYRLHQRGDFSFFYQLFYVQKISVAF